MLALKALIVALFIVVGIVLVAMPFIARLRDANFANLNRHKRLARIALSMTLVGVVLVEIAVQVKGGTWDVLHLAFAVPFLTTLVVLQKYTGFRIPGMHNKLGYACIALFFGTAITGFQLLTTL